MGTLDEITGGVAAPTLPKASDQRVPVLLVVGGPRGAVGRAYRITADTLIGRAGEADVWLDEDGISRKHARICLVGEMVRLFDLGSKNGTWVNGKRVDVAQLEESDLVQLGASHILRLVYQDQLDEAAHRLLMDGATRDSLTGAYNRGAFLDQLRKDVSSAVRHTQRLSIAALDLDHFKQINDTFGHAMGDLVLRHFSRTVGTMIRSEDTLGRLGGEEFALILRQCPIDEAVRVLERIREAVSQLDLMQGERRVAVTVSIGVNALIEGTVTSDLLLLEGADRALYRAKHDGRNRVVVHEGLPDER